MAMSHHLSCPHCESALRVSDPLPAGVIVCPRCSGEMPHPVADPDEAILRTRRVVAIALDDELAQGRSKLHPCLSTVGLFAPLGSIVVLVLCIYNDVPPVIGWLGMANFFASWFCLLFVDDERLLVRRIGLCMVLPSAVVGAILALGCLLSPVLALVQALF